jgi:hypothetical protein
MRNTVALTYIKLPAQYGAEPKTQWHRALEPSGGIPRSIMLLERDGGLRLHRLPIGCVPTGAFSTGASGETIS